jgi:hypothetical protein
MKLIIRTVQRCLKYLSICSISLETESPTDSFFAVATESREEIKGQTVRHIEGINRKGGNEFHDTLGAREIFFGFI